MQNSEIKKSHFEMIKSELCRRKSRFRVKLQDFEIKNAFYPKFDFCPHKFASTSHDFDLVWVD